MSRTHEPLSADETEAIRSAITEAVIGVPEGLRGGLESDPDEFLRLIAASRVAAETTSQLLRESIGGARASGHSWDTIGTLLGVSRQAAQQRFASPSSDTDVESRTTETLAHGDEVPPVGTRRVIKPLTSFDEMAVLAELGTRGWHSVGYGTLFHLVEKSDQQWEHRRVIWSPLASHRKLAAEGWQLIGTLWFPWAYYARPRDLPAEQ
jgi:hypothetical protein